MAKEKPEEIVEEEAIEKGADLTGLIAVAKDGEMIHVHPTCLDEHMKLGWKIVKA